MSSPVEVIAAQHELLRGIRVSTADASLAAESVLRDELSRAREKATTAGKRAAAAEKREAAAVTEAVRLRAQLAQERADADASNRRVAWDHRKREEAAAAAANERSSSAASEQQHTRAELSRLEALLAQRDAEVSALKVQLRTLRHRRQEESLQERQTAWLQDREDASGSETRTRPGRKAPPASASGRVKRRGGKEEEQVQAPEEDGLAPLQTGFIAAVLAGGK